MLQISSEAAQPSQQPCAVTAGHHTGHRAPPRQDLDSAGTCSKSLVAQSTPHCPVPQQAGPHTRGGVFQQSPLCRDTGILPTGTTCTGVYVCAGILRGKELSAKDLPELER